MKLSRAELASMIMIALIVLYVMEVTGQTIMEIFGHHVPHFIPIG